MSTATQEPAAKVEPHVYGPPVVVEVKVTIQALAFREADGRYSIVVPELPGCVSYSDTIDEAAGRIAEAADGWLACQHDYPREDRIRSVTEPLPSELVGGS